MFAVVSLLEIVAGVAGVAFEARKGGPFVFKDSLEDSLCAFVVLGLAAAYARRRERLVASAAVSGLAVGYALAKSVVVALTEGRPDTVCSVVAPLVLATAANAVASETVDVRKAVYMSLAYAGLTFTGKVMKECQSLAYLRVQKYAFIDLASDTFGHLHSLSLQWALSKKMGEVVRVTDRGIAGCDTFMKYGVLYIGPSIAEAFAVCVLFYVHFKLWALSVLVFASVFLYAALTIKLTLWRKRFRSAMNKSDNAWHDRLTDSLVNFETVKYFTAERYECDRFAEQIASYQKSSVEVQASLSALNISQQVILCGCLGGAMALSAMAVHSGDANVGGFVAVNVWVINLFAPLNFLGTVYNALITALVDLKNLSELLAQKPLVVDPDPPVDHPGSDGLFERGLAVAFEDVVFRYPGVANVDSGLRGVSFHVDAGSSLGVCGPTGAGKSTCAACCSASSTSWEAA
ncbi:ABC transporter [Aureococcus anophagefferens]|nr:ABC transporter [Aureococcus anophagefferens]